MIVLEPTVQVALIVAVPALITGVGTIVLGLMNRSQMKQISINVDGKLEQLMAMRQQLAHAEGRREGVDAAEIHTAEQLKAAIDGRIAEGIGLSGDVQMKVDGDVNIENMAKSKKEKP